MIPVKRKLISTLLLAAIALAVLFLAPEPVDYGYYFRDSALIPAANGLAGDYFDFPWASEADMSDRSALLPELPGYAVTELSGRYGADGSLWGLHVQWNGAEASCILLLDVFVEKPQDMGWARLHVMDYDRVTATQADSVTVYGDGTERSGKALEFTAADGVFYQIRGTHTVPTGDLGRVLDFCLKNSLKLPDFAETN